jgi:hypothetical protein
VTTPVSYGRDTFVTDRMRTGRTVTGLVALGQANFRRLITPRGALRGGKDEEVYGLDLTALVGRSPKNVEAALPGQIRAELMKDARNADVETTITRTTVGPAVRFDLRVTATAATGGTSTLVLAVSDVTVELLGIETEDA